MSSFIDDFIEHHKTLESPRSFWEWSAFALVGAVLRDNVWFDQGFKKARPNLYVMIVAGPGQAKSPPFSAVQKLLNHEKIGNTKSIQGGASIQKVIDILAEDTVHPVSHKPLKGGSAILLAEEFSAFFVQDELLIQKLTTMHDHFEGDHEYKLKSGVSQIKNLCLSILGASNPRLLYGIFDARAVYGGLLSRTCIVVPDERRPPAPQVRFDKSAMSDYSKLAAKLELISTFRGGMEISDAAALAYEEWYAEQHEKLAKGTDETGVDSRLKANILKLAIIIAAANCRMTIEVQDIELAILKFAEISANYDSFTHRAGKASDSDVAALLIGMLRQSPSYQVTEKEFFLRNWGMIEMKDFSDLIIKLERAGIIGIVKEAKQLTYCLTSESILKLKGGGS